MGGHSLRLLKRQSPKAERASLLANDAAQPRARSPRSKRPGLTGGESGGLYGILRVNADLMSATRVGPGLVALMVGTISALLESFTIFTEGYCRRLSMHHTIPFS